MGSCIIYRGIAGISLKKTAKSFFCSMTEAFTKVLELLPSSASAAGSAVLASMRTSCVLAMYVIPL